MKAKPDASKRTKELLKQHPNLVIKKRSNTVNGFSNRECGFMRSSDGWFGWIPLDEIEFDDHCKFCNKRISLCDCSDQDVMSEIGDQ